MGTNVVDLQHEHARLNREAEERLKEADKYKVAAEKLESAMQALTELPPASNGQGGKGRITAEGMRRIKESNQNFWVMCKVGCGVRHRRTHRHIRFPERYKSKKVMTSKAA